MRNSRPHTSPLREVFVIFAIFVVFVNKNIPI